jgi:transcriptional regulator with XRE-family HTH domain
MNDSANSTDPQRIELGARLRESREYLGLSQDEVASALGIQRPAVTLIESGGRKVEAIELKKLATLFGTSVEFLLTGQRNTSPDDEKLAYLARATQGLSDSDLDQLLRFSDYLRTSPKTKVRS